MGDAVITLQQYRLDSRTLLPQECADGYRSTVPPDGARCERDVSTDVKRVTIRSRCRPATALRLTGPFVGESRSTTDAGRRLADGGAGPDDGRGEDAAEPNGRDGESGDGRRDPEGEPAAHTRDRDRRLEPLEGCGA